MTISVLIVGGGASGTLLALRLLRGNGDFRVTLVEKSGPVGRGLAYASEDDRHVLNVVPGKMSAFADDPEHFRNWLVAQGKLRPDEAFAFVPRRHFGAYLEANLAALAEQTGRLDIVFDNVAVLTADHQGARVELASDRTMRADLAVLATGHDVPYIEPSIGAGGGDLPVLILGTGLSMVDAWLSLAASGRRIIAMSRHGLLPTAHRHGVPFQLDAGMPPLRTSVGHFTRWLRGTARALERQTGDWRPVVDALRPHTQRIWAGWSDSSRRQFLRHIKPWWDIHRHRLAPPVREALAASLTAGDTEIIAATPVSVAPGRGRQIVSFRRRGSGTIETLEVADVLDRRGLIRDWSTASNGLVGRMIADGEARADALGLGLDVDRKGRLIGGDGAVQPNLFAIGPLTRGKLFEIEAVPDIRSQCDRLATHLESSAATMDVHQAERRARLVSQR